MRNNQPGDEPLPFDKSSVEITDEKFKELADYNIKYVEESVLGTDGLNPMLIVHGKEVEEFGLSDLGIYVFSIQGDFNESDAKQKIMENIGAKAHEMGILPVAVFMLSEAWMAHDPKYRMPSEDPNRQEVILISGATFTKDNEFICCIPVARDKDKNMVRNGENNISKGPLYSLLFKKFFNGYASAHKQKQNETPPGRKVRGTNPD